MESNEDITLRPFSELTLKDVTPYLRELIQEEMSNCLVNKKLPPAFSGIKDSTIEHFLTNPELYTYSFADRHNTESIRQSVDVLNRSRPSKNR